MEGGRYTWYLSFFYTERILGFQNWHPKRTKIPKNGYVCAQFLKLFTWLASVTNIRYGGGWKEIKWEMIKTSQKLRMLSSVTIKCQGKILSWIEVLNCQIYNQCLKFHNYPGLSFQLSKWKKQLSKLLNKLSIVWIVKNCQNCKNGQNCPNLSKLSKIVKIVKNCKHCQNKNQYCWKLSKIVNIVENCQKLSTLLNIVKIVKKNTKKSKL